MQGTSNEASNEQLKPDKSEENITGMKHFINFFFDRSLKNGASNKTKMKFWLSKFCMFKVQSLNILNVMCFILCSFSGKYTAKWAKILEH